MTETIDADQLTESPQRAARVRTVLGLSSGLHDSAAAILHDGIVVAAVETERLTRVKHDAAFPSSAADCCLDIAGLDAAAVDLVVLHEKPLGVLSRHLQARVGAGPRGVASLFASTPSVVRRQLGVGAMVQAWCRRHRRKAPPVLVAEHHMSHLAAAYYPSPFEAAALLSVDGVGEWASAAIGTGHGHRIGIDRELRYPDSVGLLYSAITGYCGFRVNGGEGELMGLAPFGEPTLAEALLDAVVRIHEDGSFRLDPTYFDFTSSHHMTSTKLHGLLGGPPRPPGSDVGQREADIAASLQFVTEELLLSMARAARAATGMSALCLGGGVALNCVANGRLLREGPFEQLWVPPAPGDGGNALGAALWAWHEVLGRERPSKPHDGMAGSFLGPSFTGDEIASRLAADGIPHRRIPDCAALTDLVAERLAGGDLVGWFTGRMEFGPRALGHRSILADPRSPTVHGRLNALVKERALFRPFAPAVLADRVHEWFEFTGESPFMNVTARVHESRWVGSQDPTTPGSLAQIDEVRSTIPAVTHVDRSARLQTVDHDRNPRFAALIEAFAERTGCPVLLNTSFNARDEPIVCTPEDAHRTFVRTGLDLLVLEDCLVERP